MEDKLRRKESFDGRKASMQAKPRWKESADGRITSTEGTLRWAERFDGSKASMADHKDLRDSLEEHINEKKASMKERFPGRTASLEGKHR